VPLRSLALGRQIGVGGEGIVIDLPDRPGILFKRYHQPVANATALEDLVAFPLSLGEVVRGVVLSQSAWPLTCVTENEAVIGFLMNKAPEQFLGNTKGGPRLRELQYLLYPPKPMWGEMAKGGITIQMRLEVARRCATLVHILHEHSLVVGDLSMLNMLWTLRDQPDVFLLDCDSIRRLGHPSVMPMVAQTPGWEDPWIPASGPDIDSDRYKVALLIGRVLSRDPTVRPGAELSLLPGIPGPISTRARELWMLAGGPYGTRPDAWQWLTTLNGRRTLMPTAPSNSRSDS
jgi:hypothetical protein